MHEVGTELRLQLTTTKQIEVGLQSMLAVEQQQNPQVSEMKRSIEVGSLPEDWTKARRMVLQQSVFPIVYEVVYYINLK